MPINPWLDERLAEVRSPTTVRLLVEVAPEQEAQVLQSLSPIVVSVSRGAISRFPRSVFIPVVVRREDVPRIAEIPGVLQVAYDMPKYIRQLTRTDPLIGKYRLSSVEIPGFPLLSLLSLPLIGLSLPGLRTIGRMIKQPGVEFIPTSETRKIMEAPEDNKIALRVATLDTGILLPHPLFHPTRNYWLYSTTGEPPTPEGQGHGTHVSGIAWGDSWETRFGLLRGVADPQLGDGGLIVVKVLSNLGFGSSAGILKGLEIALSQGAQVMNLSLGGEAQGGVDEDPESRAIAQIAERAIVVVAAGNDGPGADTIGSPAFSPHVITVGAYSPLYKGLAVFSSRGRSTPWYRDHPDAWARDYAKYGENLVKPDLIAPGGGPVEEGQKPVDLIYSSASPWFDGFYDGIPDGAEGMRGTSQASPSAAGLIALALDQGLINSAADVKRKMSRRQAKNPQTGYGLLTWRSLQE